MKFLKKFLKNQITRREHRFDTCKNLHSISLAIDGEDYPIDNISFHGLGVNIERKVGRLKTGEQISAMMRIDTKIIEVVLVIVHIGVKTAGIIVQDSSGKYQIFLKHYLQAEIDGLKVRRMDSSKLQKNLLGDVSWYYGDESHELVYYTDKENRLVQFELCFIGYTFETNFKSGKSVTGKLLDTNEQLDRIHYKGSDVIDTGEEIPEEYFDLAKRFVRSIPKLPGEIRNSIEKEINKLS